MRGRWAPIREPSTHVKDFPRRLHKREEPGKKGTTFCEGLELKRPGKRRIERTTSHWRGVSQSKASFRGDLELERPGIEKEADLARQKIEFDVKSQMKWVRAGSQQGRATSQYRNIIEMPRRRGPAHQMSHHRPNLAVWLF